MRLTDIGEVKRIMESHGLHFKKQFGQNFLINESVPRRIAESCGASSEDVVLEIGPGIGTLTRELAARYDRVVAVEIDSSLVKVLGTTLADLDNVTVLESDIMKIDISELAKKYFSGKRVSVCANLPYYITTPILMKLLESGVGFEYITVMIQKEVADRLCAAPGDSDYGAVTASVSWYGHAEKLFNVSAGNFMPAPKVDSAVLRISLYSEPPAEVADTKLLMRVIRGAFAKRRKTLVNSLSGELSEFSKADITEAVCKAGVDENVRGERLGIEEFAALSNIFSDMKR